MTWVTIESDDPQNLYAVLHMLKGNRLLFEERSDRIEGSGKLVLKIDDDWLRKQGTKTEGYATPKRTHIGGRLIQRGG